MRPSDENQDNRMHAHPRPNLMSSARRGGHEDSILAKLEREPARRKGAGNGGRLAWYGTAAVVALGLTATLAWLAAGTGPAPREMVQTDDAAPAAASTPLAPVTTALIVDASPEPVVAPPPAPVPPLRLLEPAPAQAEPARVAPAVAKAPPPRRVEPRAAAPARPRTQAARPAPRQAARAARTVNPARAGETQDDSDVALISAVIYHANGHAAPDEGEAPAPPPSR